MLVNRQLSEQVIGCAYKVHRTLGSGFLEKVYENALAIELEKKGLAVEKQKKINVSYAGHVVGNYFIDLFVGNELLCEVKAQEALSREHEIQLVNYLAATGFDSGLLINFGSRVQIKRKFRKYRAKNPVNPEQSC